MRSSSSYWAFNSSLPNPNQKKNAFCPLRVQATHFLQSRAAQNEPALQLLLRSLCLTKRRVRWRCDNSPLTEHRRWFQTSSSSSNNAHFDDRDALAEEVALDVLVPAQVPIVKDRQGWTREGAGCTVQRFEDVNRI
jgi:hypothetical protein